MADTLQIVRWSLEHQCAIRQGLAAVDPKAAIEATARLCTFDECRRGTYKGARVIGDVCVTSYEAAVLPNKAKGPRPPYPSSGFIVTDQFALPGGVERLLAACAECPVNLSPERPARCCGTLFQQPFSEETDEQLRSIAGRLGLEADLLAVFPNTTPWWFGFWIEAPVSKEGARLLQVLFDAMADEDSKERTWSAAQLARHVDDLRSFARAAGRAAAGHATLHVSLAPPGHTDFGFYTVFAHCPRCKAGADVPRWTRDQPTALHTCGVCGTAFSPAETATSERYDYDWSGLRELLGQERFEKLALEYLIQHGASSSEAAAVVAATEKYEREREAEIERSRLLNERKRAWIENVLYAGLSIHRIKSADDDDDSPGMIVFLAADFEELLRRAQERGLRATILFHHSKSGKSDKYTSTGIANPLATYEKWQAEGCNEYFSAGFRIPDELVQ